MFVYCKLTGTFNIIMKCRYTETALPSRQNNTVFINIICLNENTRSLVRYVVGILVWIGEHELQTSRVWFTTRGEIYVAVTKHCMNSINTWRKCTLQWTDCQRQSYTIRRRTHAHITQHEELYRSNYKSFALRKLYRTADA